MPIKRDLPVDVEIVGGGTVFLFQLHTAKARQWVDTFVSPERQVFGCGLVVEHRYVVALVDEMQRDGLLLARGGRA